MNLRQTLRDLLKAERPLIMPDAYDGLSARLIEMEGFKAVQCSGFSMALASLAIPEARLSYDKNLAITRDIVNSVKVPVMADGEDGFGPPQRVFQTVSDFIDAGIAGINIEDQVLPPPDPKGIVECSLMTDKIRASREAATAKKVADLVINARTDSLAAYPDRKVGLREAIKRGNEYLSVGADLVFVVGVNTLDEARQLVSEIKGPVSIAAGMPSNIGTMSIQELGECGVMRVSLPTVAVLSAIRAIKQTLSLIHRTGGFNEVTAQNLLCGMEEIPKIIAK
jgi:2-methylisocitrate lyase-like PEP mutase family enzyme